ncbi:hypothetical protein ACIQU3_36630 [Streptomyces sp. NPDC101110]|uniref:hypothetical protein n=1 Tax=Streptomyces sp. NPDC101110 TaxID=3366104 RepID=UPI0037F211B2
MSADQDRGVRSSTAQASAGDSADAASGVPDAPPRPRSGVYVLEAPRPRPWPWPGHKVPLAMSAPQADGGMGGTEAAGPSLLIRETLHVDLDGLAPTMVLSGTRSLLVGGSVTWIAPVSWDDNRLVWAGEIRYRDGTAFLMPHTHVRLELPPGRQRTVRVTFTGGGASDATRRYVFQKEAFREVSIEYDCVSDATAVTSYDLRAHPNRPADLPNATLSVEDVFTRLGIAVTNTGGDNVVPIVKAGSDALWSDVEMHDAMQVHWSRWADAPQWQVWTLFAGQHELGPGLGGIMFDGIGAAQRQGCAVFSNSFISAPRPGDPHSDQAVQRLRFWTAVHEIGHCFNLAHSWQKELGNPWVPQTNDPWALSFMNYPFSYPQGGEPRFFSLFRYVFSQSELLFMRHAPERLVQPGAAPWFSEHAFEEFRATTSHALQLVLRVNRPSAQFEALEPIVAEVKLKNTSTVPIVIDRNTLTTDELAVIITRAGRPARQWLPYARYCRQPDPCLLQPGESLYAPLFLSAGLNGCDLAEPGSYEIRALLSNDSGTVLSAALPIQVQPPTSREEERLAADVYTDGVGRVLAFGGSRGHAPSLDRAIDVLHDVVERVPDSALAIHAAAALGRTAATPGRVLLQDPHDSRPKEFMAVEPNLPQALAFLKKAYGTPDTAANTLGHIALAQQIHQTALVLAQADEVPAETARELATGVADNLQARGVLASVVETVRADAAQFPD